jgi:hypothetical protein
MADRKDFYFEQVVQEDDMDAAFDYAENAPRDLATDTGLASADTVVHGGIFKGLAVSDSGLTITVTAGSAYDSSGRRIRLSTNTDVNIAFTGTTVVGSGGTPTGGTVVTTIPTAGNERWVSLYIYFDRQLLDPQIDGSGDTVYFDQPESFVFEVDKGTEAASPTNLAALKSGKILLADFRIDENSAVLETDLTRRQGWLRLVNSAATPVTRAGSGYAVRGIQIDGSSQDAIRDAFAQLLGYYNDHVNDATGTDPHSGVNINMPAVAGTPHALTIGLLTAQMAELLGHLNDPAGTYTLSGVVNYSRGLITAGGATGVTGLAGTGGATSGIGVTGQGTGSGVGVSGTGGATSATGVVGTGGASGIGVLGQGTANIGVKGIGGSNSVGVLGEGGGSGVGVSGTGGNSNAAGVTGVGGVTNGAGVSGTGTGTGTGVSGIAGGTGVGVSGTGGSHDTTPGRGGVFTGGAVSSGATAAAHGLESTGGTADSGTGGTGVKGTGGASTSGTDGTGVHGVGGTGVGDGVKGEATGTGIGVVGLGAGSTVGAAAGTGVYGKGASAGGVGLVGQGTGSGNAGIVGTGGTGNARGIEGNAIGTDPGVVGYGASASGSPSDNYLGVYGQGSGGTNSGAGVSGKGGATNGIGVIGAGVGSGVGVKGTGGTTNAAGVSGTGGATNGVGVSGTGTGSGKGVSGTGGTNEGTGVYGTGGATNGIGTAGLGAGSGSGVVGVGSGSTVASSSVANTGVYGLGGTAGGTGNGVHGEAYGDGVGVLGTSADSSGSGVTGTNTAGVGVTCNGDATSPVYGSLRMVPQDTEPTNTSLHGQMAILSSGTASQGFRVNVQGTWYTVTMS